MEVIPAIDLKGGRCVRLYQGDFSQETVFSDDPVDMAEHWQGLGALRLHLVDLDGAAQGSPQHQEVIAAVVAALRIPVQVGGGIRRLEDIEHYLTMGVERVIMGTVALEEPKLVETACQRFGPHIAVSVDARDGYVTTHAWRHRSQVLATALAKTLVAQGVRRLIYTDVATDGTLTQPNFAALRELKSCVDVPIIASGGIAQLQHLEQLAHMGMEGAIVGRALYTGAIQLKEALALCQGQEDGQA